jgi:hypothetical protein
MDFASHGIHTDYHRQPLANPPEIDDLLLVLVIFHLWKKTNKLEHHKKQ